MSTTLAAYIGFILLISAERIVELFISHRNANQAFAQGGLESGQAHFRVMSVMHSLFLLCCVAEPLLLHRSFLPALGWPCLGVALTAQGLRWWAISSLGPRWNVRIIVLPGAEPVTRGPYRFLRHPNYVAVILEMAVLPLIHSGYLTAVTFTIINGLMLLVRIRAEEAALGWSYAMVFRPLPRFFPGARRG